MSKKMAAMVVQLSPYVTPLDIQEFTVTYWINYLQRMLYATNFNLHFGVSEEMLGFLEDFCRVMAPNVQ
ncbi:unnamed protein product [Nippostrongylus brasiliensis]|uniref:GLOBIN domain-containing protein n=1 Tax=Nippostrongylus brasiliensis TaxID=27835 RepID=A0A0N4YAM5_NIPBR|nr:unnamed protein product [Nippostrongylus brasiliensis]